jgi:cell division protein FtsB
MTKRLVTAVLLLLLLALQAQLWFGRGSLPNVQQMKDKLGEMSGQNQKAQAENDRLASEVRDLKEGLDMVEEKARSELGMVKPNEIFVQFNPSKK